MKQGHSLGERSFSEFRYRGEGNGVEVEPAGLVKGEPNRVSTTRFTVLTWLPKSLFLQFQRVANIYFLFIAVIVCMPFSTKRWQSKVFPYLLVLAWTALKDLYEDMQRRKDNRVENARSCWRFNWELKEFEPIAWRLVKPGDFVCTLCDEAFPADLLVLSAADGHAFISTVNLDGETNLKLRIAPKVFSSFQMKNEGASLSAVPSELASLASEICRQQLHVRLATPCADLAEMNAVVSFPGTEDVGSIDYAACDSFAPRGCVLRNTSWLLSIAAYTGIHTKQCLNSAKVSGKVSNMQALLNRCVYGLLAFLILTCCYLATAAKSMSVHTNWPERFLAYTITLYHVVPISLYVSFEVLKLILGRFIDSDQQMVDKVGIGAKARTADLVEELGQIDFIFSDKTGTLTANEMRFARCAVGDVVFGPFIADLGGPVLGQLQVKDILSPSETSEPSEQIFAQNVLWFFICISVCHTVQVNLVNDMQYSGPSPDEVALVEGAHSVGVSLKSRRKIELQKEEIVISAPSIGRGENLGKGRVMDHVFVVLHTIEFSAERKRMSVLCQHQGVIHCITKGADIALATLLTSKLGAKEEDQLRFFSEMGLRTLVVASKTVDHSAFASWESQWLTAKGSLESRTERLAECGAMIEKDLQLVGISAVEDRLQEGVPTAIARLKDAGIRLWVLTGDKTETAVDIAYSCNLFSQGMELIFLTNAAGVAAASERLATAERSIKGDSNCGLVIDGRTLQFILEDHDSATTFYKLAMSSTSCVCTRFSPSQKRRLVDEVRKRGSSITLAIGDGANDVPMILGAHVGIGLRGKEGSQAVQASDIAISQFAFLVPLLLCHGRRAYRRVASFLCYYFYKNVALAFGDFIWAHQNSFSGEVAYPEWLSTSFNAVFTWWPVIIVLAFDQDIPDSISNAEPRIYTEGIKREWFNIRLFALWMMSAAFQGSLAWILPNFLFGSFDYEAVDFWRASATSFTMVIVIVALKLALHDFNRCSLSCLLPIIGSIASYIIVLFLLGYVPLGQRMQPNLAGDPPVPGWIFSNATPILVITLASPLALLPDMVARLWVRKLHPSPLFQIRSKNL